MASRVSLIQSRSIYVGTSNSVAPSDGNLIVSGNVGIGTTSPAFTSGDGLEIQRSSATATLRLDSGVFATELRAYTDGTFLGQLSNSYLDLGTNNSTKVRITGDGNVGIGVTNPYRQLSLNNQINNGSAPIASYGAGPTTGLGQNFFNGYYASDSDGLGPYPRYFDIVSTGYPDGSNGGSNIRFFTNPIALNSPAVPRMVITSAGNVGIGTTAPGAKLDIAATNSTLAISYGNTVPNNPLHTNYYGGFTGIGMDSATAGVRIVGDTNTLVMDAGYYTSGITQHANWNSLLRVLTNGNVGIGTTAPTTKLHVVTNAVSGRQNMAAIDRTAANLIRFTNPQYSADASMGLLLRVFPDSDARQGAGIIASGGSNNATTDLDLFVTTSPDGLGGTSYSAIKINGLNGNVGIGTTAPSYKLHVEGSTYVSSTLRLIGNMTVGGDTSQWQLAGVANGGAIWQKSNSGAGGSDDRYLRFGNIDNNGVPNYVVSIHNSNVGIGTTAPATKLHVAGNGAFTGISVTNPDTSGTFNRSSIDVASNQITMGLTAWGQGSVRAGTAWVQTVNNYPLVLGTNDNEVMRLLTNGNVGIGTTNPTYKLQVAGTSYFSAEQTIQYTDAISTINGSTGWGLFRIYGGSNSVELQMDASSTTTGAATIGTYSNSDLYIKTNNTNKVVVKANGNVGINSTNPGAKLEVISANLGGTAGDQTLQALFSASNGNGSYLEVKDVRTSTGADWTFAAKRIQMRIDSTYMGYVQFNGTGNNAGISFGAGTTTTAPGNVSEQMRITAAGNVGINTTNPTERLDVAGNGKLQGNLYLTATDPVIEGSGSGAMRIRHTAGQSMYIRPDQAGAVVFFEGVSGQTVYLNTASPSVNSTQNSSATLTFEARARNAGGTLNIRSTSLQNTVYDIPNNLSRFSITGQNILYLEGNVGIGTTSPARALNVSSNGTAGTQIQINGTQDSAGIKFVPASGDNWEVQASTSNQWFVYNRTDESYRLLIDGSGNVGIGTTAPLQNLHVSAGHIVIENTYALYVNGSDYNWGVGRNIVTDSGFLSGNTLQAKVFNGTTQGFQVVNSSNTALFEVEGNTGRGRIIGGFAVGSITPSTTAGRIDASNDVVAYSTSDSRLKENITQIANALDKVKSLTGVEFDWKEDTKDVHGYEGHDVGVIAQEVQAVLPEAIRTNDTGYLSVRYEKMIALLIEGMKEQQNQIDELKAKLDGLTK